MPTAPTAGRTTTPTCLWPTCHAKAAHGPLCADHGPSWRQLAACRGTDLAVWFHNGPDNVAAARDICAHCPVARPCLADALDAEHGLPASKRFGVRAGLDPAQRVAAAHRSAQTMPAVNRR